MSDIDDVTEAAERVESRLPHPTTAAPLEQPMRRYTFADLISAADKEKLLEFGRNII